MVEGRVWSAQYTRVHFGTPKRTKNRIFGELPGHPGCRAGEKAAMNRAPPKRQKPSRFVENIHDLRAPPNGGGPGFNSVRGRVFGAHGTLYHIVFIHLALSGSLRKKI